MIPNNINLKNKVKFPQKKETKYNPKKYLIF